MNRKKLIYLGLVSILILLVANFYLNNKDNKIQTEVVQVKGEEYLSSNNIHNNLTNITVDLSGIYLMFERDVIYLEDIKRGSCFYTDCLRGGGHWHTLRLNKITNDPITGKLFVDLDLGNDGPNMTSNINLGLGQTYINKHTQTSTNFTDKISFLDYFNTNLTGGGRGYNIKSVLISVQLIYDSNTTLP